MLRVQVPASDDSVLQPDATFGPPPLALLAQGLTFAVCGIFSAVAFCAALPFASVSGVATLPGPKTWSLVFAPLLVYGAVNISFHAYYILIRKKVVRIQLGPEPDPAVTVAAAGMQWDILHRTFLSQHVAANCSDIVLYIGISASASVLLASLVRGEEAQFSFRAAALPVTVAGLGSVIIHTLYQLRYAPPAP